MRFSVRRLFHIENMRRREHATLRYSYAGEFGRGMFAAMGAEFALLIAISHFGITNRYLLWMVSSAGFLGLIVAVFSAPLTGRYLKKQIIMGAEILARLIAITAAFQTTGTGFAVAISTGVAVNTFGVPLLSGIYGANLRADVRGHIVGRLLAIMVGMMAVTGALGGFLLGVNTGYYRVLLIVVSVVSLCCSWYANHHLPEARRLSIRKVHGSLKDYINVFKTDMPFVYVEIIWFIIGLSNLWLIPIRVLWLKEIGLNEMQVMLATMTVVCATTVLTVPLWGRIIYRINFGLFRIILSVLFLIGTLVFFHSGSFVMACAGSFIFALALSGGQLSWRLIATFFTSPDKVPLYMSIHAFFCGVRGLLGPLLSLGLHEEHGAQFVAHISAGGFALSIVLLIPLVKVFRKRAHSVL